MDYPTANYRNVINDPNQCRLCMRVCDDSFLECIFSDKEYGIAHQIFECTSIRVTKQDNLTKICKNCATLLLITTEFRNACFKTNRLLMEDFVILELGDWASEQNRYVLRACEDVIVRHKRQVDYLYASIVSDSEQCLEGSLEIGRELFVGTIHDDAPDATDVGRAEMGTLEPEEPDPEILMEITKFLEEQQSPQDGMRLEHEERHTASTSTVGEAMCCLCGLRDSRMLQITQDQTDLVHALKLVVGVSVGASCECCTLFLDSIRRFQRLVLTAQQTLKEVDKRGILVRVENYGELLKTVLTKLTQQEEHNKRLLSCVEPTENSVTYETQSFPSRKARKSHKRNKVTCHVCGKQYDSWKLQTHLNEHENVRPYVCDHEGCNSSFAGLVLLNRHKKLWHTDYFYATCDVCGKKCKTQGIYQTHVSYHEEPKIPCPVCGKLMRNKRAIWKHMKTHSNERKHVCSVCNKKFTIAYTLRVHMRIHTNDKPYPCSKCDKRFQYKCLLKNHCQRYHVDDA